MMRTVLAALALAAAPLGLAAPGLAQQAESPAFLDLTWEDLLPPGEAENIARLQQMQAVAQGLDHFGTEQAPQIQTFNVVEDLEGRQVRLPGYVLPFDFTGSGEVNRFLLVPYVGACVHVPPPPPNQLVFVRSEEPVPVEGLWDPVFAHGVMRIERQDNELGDAAYTLELTELQPYRP